MAEYKDGKFSLSPDESKNNIVSKIMKVLTKNLGLGKRLSEMSETTQNNLKGIRNSLNELNLNEVRAFAQKVLHGGGPSSATAAQRMINDQSKKGLKSFKEEQKLRKSLKSDMGSQVSKPRAGKGSSAVGTTGIGVRSGAKTGTSKRKSSVKDVAPLGGSSYKIKSGDTLSAIARRNNTTVAALMKLNPKITDKDKIRAGQFIKVGSPEKAKAKTKSVKSIRDFATSIAEAKRKGLKEYRDTKTGRMKAAVTAEELKKSGLTLREYLNKMKKKMNMGGMMSPTKRKPTGSATGLTGMKGGGMMKKKGYAKGGMKKKGYARGGMKKDDYAIGGDMRKRPAANQKGLKKLPTAVRNKMGYMAKGGITMKKKGMAKGGAMMKKKGMAKGGAARRGR
jgi:LysM repeat protein